MWIKKVFDAAETWIECSDYIPAVTLWDCEIFQKLRGMFAPRVIKRMYSDDWGGYPDKEFLVKLIPKDEKLRETLETRAYPVDEIAGYLSKEWANKFSG